MSIYEDIRRDQAVLAQLFHELEKISSHEVERRERLFSSLMQKLNSHIEAFEAVFSRALRSHPRLSREFRQCNEDHQAMDLFIETLFDLGVTHPKWKEFMHRLKEEFDRQCEDEERLLQLAQSSFSAKQARQLAVQMQQWKRDFAPKAA